MYRVKITKAPKAAMGLVSGDQSGSGLFMAGSDRQHATSQNSDDIHAAGLQRYLQPVEKGEANIEAERGETIVGDFDQDGMEEHLAIGGKRHAYGGTPLQVPDGSFIFSDTRKMRIGGPLLQEFGKSAGTKKKFTPAQLAKQYELNKYKAMLQDPYADNLQRDTAQLMMANNQLKLSKLALLQEGMKGFPQGVPSMAMPLMQRMMENGQEGQMSQMGQETEAMARYGGLIKADRGYSWEPVDPYRGDRGDPRKDQQRQGLKRGFNQFHAPWLTDFGYDDSPEGLNEVLRSKGYTGDFQDTKAVQQFLIQKNLEKGNYNLFQNLLKNYRMTNQGMRAGLSTGAGDLPASFEDFKNNPNHRAILEKMFADGMFGVRSGEMLRALFPDFKLSVPSVKRIPIEPGKINIQVKEPKAFSYEPSITTDDPDPRPVAKFDNTPLHWKQRPNDKMPWLLQDKFNTGASIADYFNLQQDNPTLVGTNVVLPNVSLLDPARQIAASQEAANSQNMIAAMYAGPQRWRAVTSNTHGQNAPNLANALSQVHNSNIGIVNAKEMANAETINKNEVLQKAALKNYFDEWATVRQQVKNSKAAALQNVRNNILSGFTNASKLQQVNAMHPQYHMDASGRFFFTGIGKGIQSDALNSQGSDPLSLYDAYLKRYNTTFPSQANTDRAFSFAEKMALGNKSRYGVDSDGDASMSMSGYLPSPQAQALLSMFGKR
jgi:hypothetical protein